MSEINLKRGRKLLQSIDIDLNSQNIHESDEIMIIIKNGKILCDYIPLLDFYMDEEDNGYKFEDCNKRTTVKELKHNLEKYRNI